MDDIAPRPLLDEKDLAAAIDHAESLPLADRGGCG